MKHLPFYILLFCLIIAGSGCSSVKKSPAAAAPDPVQEAHTSRNSVDWPGTYRGVLPCDDCDGILTTLTIHSDLTWKMSTQAEGKSTPAQETTGTFEWVSGQVIRLSGLNPELPALYFVGENLLVRLDPEGNRVTGDQSDHYRLEKISASIPDLADSLLLTQGEWILAGMGGQPFNAGDGEAVWLRFHSEDQRLSGSAGCNTIMGSYLLLPGRQLSLPRISTTRMACPDMQTEITFLDFLRKCDRYSLREDELTLGDAESPRLLVFRQKTGE